MRRLLFFASFLTIFTSFLFAQEEEPWHCDTDEIYLKLLEENPDILKEREKLRLFVDNYIANSPKEPEVYIIPVVFHIVHYYGVENISYEQIQDAIDFMNWDFNHLRSDTANIVDEFKNIAADCDIEFRLARKDPYGNCTIGVTRTVSETTFGGGEDAKEAAPTWPPEMYLNVWVVNNLSGGAAGWSYYPGTAPYGRDGVILLHDYVGYTGTSSYTRGSTLTHEVGHYLNLGHPWGHTNDPEVSSNCEIDDGIEDTPNTIGHTTCALSAVTCGSLDNTQNFMEYSYCTKMFTWGQADEMRAVLNSDVSGRNNLHSEANLLATGTSDDYIPETCPPVADFMGSKRIGCQGFTVEYNDLTYGTDEIDSRSWVFEGGNPTASNSEFPVVTYDTKGAYDVTLTSYNSVSNDQKISQEYIRAYDKSDGYTLPYTESFETSTFPKITGNDNNDFYLESRGEENWEQTSYGYDGDGLRIMNKRNDIGTLNRLYLPNIRITEFDKPILVSFKSAYGISGEGSGDRLKFFLSTSCGDSLRIIHFISGSTLISTTTSAYGTYVPMSSHWKTHSFLIDPSKLDGENLRLIVEAEAGGGNTLYIDEFSFSYSNSVNQIISTDLISIFPNPSEDEVFIENQLDSDEYTIQIFDNMGRKIFETKTSESVYNARNAFEGRSPGLYLIKVITTKGTKILKLNKVK